MTFKIHDKLNRIVEVSTSLQQYGTQITNLSKVMQAHEKELDLLTVHYMQTEMEYGKLIGEEIDHLAAIETLLQKHGKEKPETAKEIVPIDGDFYLIKRSDGMYWGGLCWEKNKHLAHGYPNEVAALALINSGVFWERDNETGKAYRYNPVLNFADYDAANPNSVF